MGPAQTPARIAAPAFRWAKRSQRPNGPVHSKVNLGNKALEQKARRPPGAPAFVFCEMKQMGFKPGFLLVPPAQMIAQPKGGCALGRVSASWCTAALAGLTVVALAPCLAGIRLWVLLAEGLLQCRGDVEGEASRRIGQPEQIGEHEGRPFPAAGFPPNNRKG